MLVSYTQKRANAIWSILYCHFTGALLVTLLWLLCLLPHPASFMFRSIVFVCLLLKTSVHHLPEI